MHSIPFCLQYLIALSDCEPCCSHTLFIFASFNSFTTFSVLAGITFITAASIFSGSESKSG
jgi:hypothetical protein